VPLSLSNRCSNLSLELLLELLSSGLGLSSDNFPSRSSFSIESPRSLLVLFDEGKISAVFSLLIRYIKTIAVGSNIYIIYTSPLIGLSSVV